MSFEHTLSGTHYYYLCNGRGCFSTTGNRRKIDGESPQMKSWKHPDLYLSGVHLCPDCRKKHDTVNLKAAGKAVRGFTAAWNKYFGWEK